MGDLSDRFKPLADAHAERQPAAFDQHGDFPCGYGRNGDLAFPSVCLDCFARSWG